MPSLGEGVDIRLPGLRGLTGGWGMSGNDDRADLTLPRHFGFRQARRPPLHNCSSPCSLRLRLSRLVDSSKKLFRTKNDMDGSTSSGSLDPFLYLCEDDSSHGNHRMVAGSSGFDPAPSMNEENVPDYTGNTRGESEEKWTDQWTPPNAKWIDLEDIRQWMYTCDYEHGDECFPSSAQYRGRPLWLIDVEQKCLVPAGEHRYMALSYVWGGVESAQTTTDNIESMQRPGALGGSHLVVPRTIRHAMGLVQRLGETHLWVDRFCICQDDVTTKHAQLGFMADIYENAYLTIVAASEWDADHGLRGIEGLTKPRDLSPYMTTDQYKEVMKMDNAIWSSRGWTFQEMVFSRRKLLFQYQMVRWECCHSVWHESTGVSGRTPGNLTGRDPSWHRPHGDNVRVVLKGFEGDRTLRRYSTIVERYNTRNLSYPEDGIRAFLGVIQRFSEVVPGGFFWGLPISEFHAALLWQPRETLVRRLSRRRGGTGAPHELPSWSWVGWQGNINIDFYARRRESSSIVPLCAWNVTNEHGMLGLLAVNANLLHGGEPFLHAPHAAVARAWLRNPAGVRRTSSSSRVPVHAIGQVVEEAYMYDGRSCGGNAEASWIYSSSDPTNMTVCGGLFLSAGLRDRLPAWEECEFLAISTVNRRTDMYGEELPQYYNVLWIRRKDGVVYRKGLGFIMKDAWDNLNPKKEDIILG